MSTFLALAGIALTLYFAFWHETQEQKDAQKKLQEDFIKDLEKLIEEGEEEEYQTFKRNLDRYYEEKGE